jgi:hypothetical protein
MSSILTTKIFYQYKLFATGSYPSKENSILLFTAAKPIAWNIRWSQQRCINMHGKMVEGARAQFTQ